VISSRSQCSGCLVYLTARCFLRRVFSIKYITVREVWKEEVVACFRVMSQEIAPYHSEVGPFPRTACTKHTTADFRLFLSLWTVKGGQRKDLKMPKI
jgi:hypothetical protein